VVTDLLYSVVEMNKLSQISYFCVSTCSFPTLIHCYDKDS